MYIHYKWKFLLIGENFHKHQNKKINRNKERKNKTQEGGEKKREKRKRKENAHRRKKKDGCLIFLLSLGFKREILKLMFNAINCSLKHNNLLC